MKFYKEIWKYKIDIDLSFTQTYNGKIYHSSSPSIIRQSNGDYLINIRVVNYYITENGSYIGCDDHIITENKCIQMDSSFNIISEKMIPSPSLRTQRYIGVEDVRIFEQKDGSIRFTGTHLDKELSMCYGTYTTDNELIPTTINPIFFPSTDRQVEKNWVYINDNEMIYKWYPLTICNHSSNSLTKIRELQMPKIFKRIRGSTNGSQWDNEIWFITHIVSYEQPRHYYHMMVVFNSDMTKLLRYSTPFKFTNNNCIEYCLGLVVEKNRVLISYSTMDRTSHIAVYEKKYIKTKLINN